MCGKELRADKIDEHSMTGEKVAQGRRTPPSLGILLRLVPHAVEILCSLIHTWRKDSQRASVLVNGSMIYVGCIGTHWLSWLPTTKQTTPLVAAWLGIVPSRLGTEALHFPNLLLMSQLSSLVVGHR